MRYLDDRIERHVSQGDGTDGSSISSFLRKGTLSGEVFSSGISARRSLVPLPMPVPPVPSLTSPEIAAIVTFLTFATILVGLCCCSICKTENWKTALIWTLPIAACILTALAFWHKL